MQIKEAEIYSFGKFQKQTFAFMPGINVIYGANEAGKSTLHAFLMAMLFGMEKGRGRSVSTEGYQRYEPWHAPSYYSGALRFEVDEKPFFLERNFYHKEKRDFLRNEADGEELSVAYGDLTMLLGGIDKETFGNTYNISQNGAVTGKELAESMAEYLSDASESGNSSFHVTKAVEALKEKKKKFVAQQKEELARKEQKRMSLQTEYAILQQDCVKLREDIARAEQNMRLSEAETGQEKRNDGFSQEEFSQHEVKVETKLRMPGILLTILGFIGLGAAGFLYKIMSSREGILFACGAGIVLLLGILLLRRKQYAPVEKVSVESRPEAESQAEQMLAILYEAVNDKETRMYNITEQLEALERPTAREQELAQELEAVVLAMDTIQNLAKEICEEAGDLLNAEVSRYVSAITAGRYDSVRVDENGKLWVIVDGKEISPEALSRGTLEQFYLALRLAVGKIVTQDELMPIFLDDALVMYDEERLMQVLEVLSNMGVQVLLFTCQRREAETLDRMGINYHFIQMK